MKIKVIIHLNKVDESQYQMQQVIITLKFINKN